MKIKVLLMTLVFAISMVAQTATPAPQASTGKADTTCSCPNCKDCCKDGKCASGGACCGKDAKCVRKSGGKMAMADCCGGKCDRKAHDKTAKMDCCKDGKCMKDGKCTEACMKDGKCCGDMAKSETASANGKSCCGGKCDRKAHETKPGV